LKETEKEYGRRREGEKGKKEITKRRMRVRNNDMKEIIPR
jgi:hypothetical protein